MKTEGRSVFKILTGTPAEKRSLGRPRHRWEDNMRMDLKEIGINTRNLIDWAQDRDYWRALDIAIKVQFLIVVPRIHIRLYPCNFI